MSIQKELLKRINKEKQGLEDDRKRVAEVQSALLLAQSAVERRESYISGLQDAIKLMPADEDTVKPSIRTLRPGTLMARARSIILKAGQPLYIDDIIGQINSNDPNARTSLAGSLRNYAKKQEIFTQTAPNTFGLIELAEKTVGSRVYDEEFDPFKDDDQ